MTDPGTPPLDSSRYDLLLVGGGLQNGLIALACLGRDAQLRVALIEREGALGGNHTWAIHPNDVPADASTFVAAMVAHRWRGYDVRFQGLTRSLQAPYCAITSHSFAAAVSAAFAASPGSRLLLGRRVREIGAAHVVLEDGVRLTGSLVIDARGPAAAESDTRYCGFQKFLGLELELAEDHDLGQPILMDATVKQSDGFRFFYVLPFDRRRVLVEETFFSRAPDLDLAHTRQSVLEYAARFGRIAAVAREERGVLPMPWRGMPQATLASPLAAGYQGGWFHPATGYSFPVALRLALHVARFGPGRVLGPELAALQHEHRRQARFAERLNQLLFTAFAPDAMCNVFERFYRLPDALIHRFYSLSLSRLDQARILVGRPPRGFSLASAWSAAS